jgi:hypothetical protein
MPIESPSVAKYRTTTCHCRPFFGSKYTVPGQHGWFFDGLLGQHGYRAIKRPHMLPDCRLGCLQGVL